MKRSEIKRNAIRRWKYNASPAVALVRERPKNSDITVLSDAYIQFDIDRLNNRPRKCLGFRTPDKVFNNYFVARNLRTKQKRCPDCSFQRFYFSFPVTEATLKGFGGSRMYTFEPPILYSEAFSAESLLRSTPKMNKFKLFTRRYGAIRSFFGGFSSTAGYVPGNEVLWSEDLWTA